MTREFVVAADVDDYDQIILSLAAQEVRTREQWKKSLLVAVDALGFLLSSGCCNAAQWRR